MEDDSASPPSQPVIAVKEFLSEAESWRYPASQNSNPEMGPFLGPVESFGACGKCAIPQMGPKSAPAFGSAFHTSIRIAQQPLNRR